MASTTKCTSTLKTITLKGITGRKRAQYGTDLEVLDPLPQGRESVQDVALDVVRRLGVLEEGVLQELLRSRPLGGVFHQAEADELLEGLKQGQRKAILHWWNKKEVTQVRPRQTGCLTGWAYSGLLQLLWDHVLTKVEVEKMVKGSIVCSSHFSTCKVPCAAQSLEQS